MKKTFTIILTLALAVAIAVSTSGCMVITAKKKEEDKGKILSLLKEKYGEEFEIRTIKSENYGGGANGVPNFDALFDFSGRYIRYKVVCSPKANEEIVFEALAEGDGSKIFSDDYPQAVIEKKAKDMAEEIVSKYTDNFIVYTYVSAPSKTVSTDDSTWEKVTNAKPYTSAEEITIENYVNKYFETSDLVLEIVICTEVSEKFAQHQKMLDELNLRLEKLKTLVRIYYVDEKTKISCEEYINNNRNEPRISVNDIIPSKRLYYVYYRRQETNYNWIFNEDSSVTSYE